MNEDKALTCLGAIAAIVIGSIVSVAMHAWALTKLWLWFIAPVFGMNELKLWQAAGLAVLISFSLSDLAKDETDDKTTSALVAALIVKAIFLPLFYVFVGWVIWSMR